jgi:hypothetical protein
VRNGLRSRAERERFLADVHVGILHVADAASTLGVPVWYQYTMAAGVYRVRWNGKSDDGRALSSGVYFARLEAADSRDVARLMMLK